MTALIWTCDCEYRWGSEVRMCEDCGRENPRLTMTDLRSHEPPRNSGEGTAVNGPMPLGEKPESPLIWKIFMGAIYVGFIFLLIYWIF